jgi:hypothetical protein
MRLHIGVPLYIHWSVPAMGASFAALPLMASGDGRGLLGFFLMSGFIVLLVLIHELGHALAATAFRSRVLGVALHAQGGLCFVERVPESRAGRVLVICGGVLAQAVVFAGAALAIWLLGSPDSYWLVCGAIVFLGVNPLFMLFSMVPHGDNDAAQLVREFRRGG